MRYSMLVSSPEPQSELQKKIADQLSGVFESVIKEREAFFKKNSNEIPNLNDVKSIIIKYSYKNAGITGGLSLIPGPFGLIAAIPEIILVVRNQISMVYDIGLAYGRHKVLKPEVLMYIVASAMGNATGTLAIMHGSKILVKRASLKVMQQLIKILTGSIAQRLLRSMVAKFLPILGALALATWTKYSTSAIGKKAANIFEQEIVYDENNEITDLGVHEIIEEKSTPETVNIEKEQILCLISLIKIDKKIKDEEIEFVKPMIDNLNVPEIQKQYLSNLAINNEKVNFNIEVFKNNPNESIPLIMDMVALAKRDNEFHPAEILYIKQIAKQLNFSEDDIAELL